MRAKVNQNENLGRFTNLELGLDLLEFSLEWLDKDCHGFEFERRSGHGFQ